MSSCSEPDSALGDGADEVAAGLRQLQSLLGDAGAKLSMNLTRLAESAEGQRACVQRLVQLSDREGHNLPERLDALLANLTARLTGYIDAAGGISSRLIEEAESLRNIINEVSGRSTHIDEIAHRTRLVALNAAATAERAGDQGRAFGAIAHQVTQLPTEAAELSKRLRELTDAAKERLLRAMLSLRQGQERSHVAVSTLRGQLDSLQGELMERGRVLQACIEGAGKDCVLIDGAVKTALGALEGLRQAEQILERERAQWGA